MNNVKELDKLYVAATYARFPVDIVKGKGSYCYDENSVKYIDMGAGIAVNTFGFSDGKWKKAVIHQLNAFQHTSNLYYTEPCALLAKALCEKTGMKKVFFANSGAEANECAIKVARRYAAEKFGKDCYNIITLKNSFHGRTIATLAATGQDVFHKDFAPFPDGFLYAEANDINGVKDLMQKNKVAAVMIECVQGEGGVNPLPDEFVKELSKLCNKTGALLIVDEVQTGNGRTGKLYAYMHYGIKPDIITTAKGLGGGLPIGACIMGEKAEKVLSFGDHGSTFGGNPVSCAGALNIFNRLDDKLLDEVNKKSEYIFNRLKNAKGVVSVSGKGLMIGVKTEKDAKAVVKECINKGVLVLTAKDKVRLLPALNIPSNALKAAIDVLCAVCAQTL
ncbi:MAG: aspartate aminotransferase family protein [Clostridia bacterium]|nr:aspartate aminotransferase family protein [Clostridia bacterium]